MILFKSCPRCRGDIQISGDIYGDYKHCLNCGMVKDISSSEARRALLVPAGTKRRAS